VLKLRRGTVVGTEPLTVRVGDSERRAWADTGLVGEVKEGDEVVVNVEALDLDLGSGGFDVVHVNLTRGLEGGGADGPHVMKLNYTSLQHPVAPVEESAEAGAASAAMPVLVVFLHGQLAPAAWAAGRAAPGLKLGYVQTQGAALPGSLSRDVTELRERDLLCDHVSAGPSYGGEREAISTAGALDAGRAMGWEAAVVGPGPGILGSASTYGHGGMAALDNAHAALALGLDTLVAPRLSSGDPRPRHHGLSHHAETVLKMLLAPVRVPVPELEAADRPAEGDDESETSALDSLRQATGDRHEVWVRPAPLDEYADSALPTKTMGRELDEDRLFFAAALAAGDALGALARQNP
jgi:hypothetical protein